MKSALRAILRSVRADALRAPAPVFDAGRRREPALAAHADVASVLEALADDTEATYPAREALTRALLTEHRASGASLWSSILLVAFYPMLSRLRGRLISDTVPGDELDQLVITTFLATVAELPLTASTDRLAMRLRQRTQRQVFAFLGRERMERHPSPDPDGLSETDPDVSVPELRAAGERHHDLALLLQRAATEGSSQTGLEVIEATVLRDELLRSYVAREYAGEDEVTRERTYQRLKRQRSRTLGRLKAMADARRVPASAG